MEATPDCGHQAATAGRAGTRSCCLWNSKYLHQDLPLLWTLWEICSSEPPLVTVGRRSGWVDQMAQTSFSPHLVQLCWWVFLSLQELTAHLSCNILFSEEPGPQIPLRTSAGSELGWDTPRWTVPARHDGNIEGIGVWQLQKMRDLQSIFDNSRLLSLCLK